MRQYPWAYSVYDKNDQEIDEFHSFEEAWDFAIDNEFAYYILNNKVQSRVFVRNYFEVKKWKRQS